MIPRAPRHARANLAPLARRLRFVCTLRFASVSSLALLCACAPEIGPVVEVVDTVYFEDAHDSKVTVEPGTRFAIALPRVTKVAGVVQRAPRRPNVDGKVLTVHEMGEMPKAWVEQAGGEGVAYIIEALEAGRSKVVIFDAAHRERFVLHVTAGDPPPEAGNGRVREEPEQRRFNHQRVPPVPPGARPPRDASGKPTTAEGALPPTKATLRPQLKPEH